MDDLTEQDYRELTEYLIGQLLEHQADDIIQQIQELENVNVVEKATEVTAMTVTKPRDLEGQIKMNAEEWEENHVSKGRKRETKKWNQNMVSEYHSRPMNHQEKFFAAIDILETYLVSVPKLFVKLKKGLAVENLSEIIWATDTTESVETPESIERIKAVESLNPQDQTTIEQIINELKHALRERSTYDEG